MKKTPLLLLIALFCGCSGRHDVSSQKEQQEYEQDRDKVVSLDASLSAGEPGELKPLQELGDGLDKKWSSRNREYHARLMLEVCKPLSSGSVNDDRRHDVARRYALSALGEADMIPLLLELELIGHVVTPVLSSKALSAKEFAQVRKKDVVVRLHAWRRLTNAVDPKWDPHERIIGGDGATESDRRKIEAFTEQYRLHDWLKEYPKRAETYIIRAYSRPPFNLEELRQVLGVYLTDKATKTRMLDAVEKSVGTQARGESSNVERTP